MKIAKTRLKQLIKEELEAALGEGFQDPGGEADPDSHWGQERQKKADQRAWDAGAEERGKAFKKAGRARADAELQKKIASYITMLDTFTDQARTYKSSYGAEGDRNIMDDIVSLIRGDMPYRYKADISNINRKKITELGYLIKTLAKPYNVLNGALHTRDYEIHQARPPGPEKTKAQKERDQYESDMFLASHGIMQESLGIMQENLASARTKDILTRMVDPRGLFSDDEDQEEVMEVLSSHSETREDYKEALKLIMKVQAALSDPDSKAVYTDNKTGERLISVDAILDFRGNYELSQIPVSNWVEMLPKAVPIFGDLQQAVTTIYIRDYSED